MKLKKVLTVFICLPFHTSLTFIIILGRLSQVQLKHQKTFFNFACFTQKKSCKSCSLILLWILEKARRVSVYRIREFSFIPASQKACTLRIPTVSTVHCHQYQKIRFFFPAPSVFATHQAYSQIWGAGRIGAVMRYSNVYLLSFWNSTLLKSVEPFFYSDGFFNLRTVFFSFQGKRGIVKPPFELPEFIKVCLYYFLSVRFGRLQLIILCQSYY